LNSYKHGGAERGKPVRMHAREEGNVAVVVDRLDHPSGAPRDSRQQDAIARQLMAAVGWFI
jgi:hypothetical protein